METKKSKVTKVTKFDKQDSYGNTSYSIEFENGDKGFFTTKDADQKKFAVGSEAEYEISQHEKKDKSGTYNKIKTPVDAQPFVKGGGPGKFQQDPKIQFISFSMSYVKDMIVGGKVQLGDLEKEFNRMYNLMIGKL